MQEKDSKELLFLGAPLLDVTARCKPETLEKYGLKPDDCIRETDLQETLLRSIIANPDFEKTAGGSAQNTARIAKWILGDQGRVTFVGCVGIDEDAKTMRKCLESEGVESLYIPLPGESTGVCACLLSPNGARSMIARLGAAAHIDTVHLREEAIQERIRKAHCIFSTGYVFGHSPDLIKVLADTCRDNQVFSMSVSAEYVCRNYANALSEVLHRIDVLFSNEAEAKVLAHSLRLEHCESVEDIAQTLARRDRSPTDKPRIVVITRGPNPVLVAQGNDPVCSFPVPKGVQVMDGVGCGDAMAGAFLAVYALTGDVPLATKTGISAAMEILQVTGCKIPDKKLYQR